MEMRKVGHKEEINALFDELVPASGKADTVAGEIIRAISRIGYRWYNDGDQLGIGYGKETCNPAGRYLAATCPIEIARHVSWAWGIYDDSYGGAYDQALKKLEDAVLDYIEQNPELKEQENTEDMWDYRNKEEDVDDSWDEEEDDYYEEW